MNKELDEKDFIQETYKKHPKPFWWILILFLLFVGFMIWAKGTTEELIQPPKQSLPDVQHVPGQ